MTILQKLQKIEESKCLYNICFRKAGVALQFYDAARIKKPVFEKRFKRAFLDTLEKGDMSELSKLAEKFGLDKEVNLVNWREGLVIEHYYPTLKEAIEAEFKRL